MKIVKVRPYVCVCVCVFYFKRNKLHTAWEVFPALGYLIPAHPAVTSSVSVPAEGGPCPSV